MSGLSYEHDYPLKSVNSFEEFCSYLKNFYNTQDFERVVRAYRFAGKAHEGAFRKSGDSYITHPMGVAFILAQIRLDADSLISALLHDTVEDTDVTLEDIEKNFGKSVRYIVDGVTKITKLRFRHTHQKQGENIRKMIIAMGQDLRVILVKLADRLHNMRTLQYMSYQKQSSIALETLDIYAPLASRLGISSMKVELEDLGFKFAYPDQAYKLEELIDKTRRERQSYVNSVKKTLTEKVRSAVPFDFTIQGRFKNLYSIFKKMEVNDVSYDEIYDLLGIRICVNQLKECYEVLGIVHSLWKPIPGRFKDFIAMPKANNYQSLHTTVINQGERVEVQIRTHFMHHTAEWGVAAHWKYKEGSYTQQNMTDQEYSSKAVDQFHWVGDLIKANETSADSDEFLENIKSDLVDTDIYIFTPKGDVKEFPQGSTPIDFAYSVHTDIGDSIVSARVNKKIVSLKHQLKNGDTVEVITSKNQSPSKDWLKYCVTTKAKNRIRAYVRSEQRKLSEGVGKDLLEKAFRKKGLSLSNVLKKEQFSEFLKNNGCHKAADLFVLSGYGKVEPEAVVQYFVEGRKDGDDKQVESLQSLDRFKGHDEAIKVGGQDNIMVHFAKCCYPIPGDPIVGFVSRVRRGISVHRADCEKTFELDSKRYVDVSWATDVANKNFHFVKLCVLSENVPGLLAKVAEVFSNKGINIANAHATADQVEKAKSYFDLQVYSLGHLNEAMVEVRKIQGVIQVFRTHNH